MKKLLAIGLALVMVLGMLSMGVLADEPEPPATEGLPTSIRGETKFATKTVISFDEENAIANYVQESSAGRCTFELADGAIGKGLKLTSGTNTSELYVQLPTDEGSTAQNWSYYDGIMWYVDNTGLSLNTDQVLSGTGIRVFPKSSYAWTRNTTAPVLPDFAIDAYYLKNGEWTLCDQSKMNGERLMLPVNFAGWIYVPFSSYITVKGASGNPEQGIVGSEIVSKLMLLSGPYATTPEGCSSLIFDEITLVKFGMTNEELAAYIAEHQPEPQDPEEQIQPGEYAMPTAVQGETKYATKFVENFDGEGVAERINPVTENRCTFEIVDGANGKGLKLVSKDSTGEVKLKLVPDEGNPDDAQDWSAYEGIMWWMDITGVTHAPGKDYSGSGLRVYATYGNGYSWTRNKAGDLDPAIPGFVIDAYYYYNGEWRKCDQGSMDGERIVVPQNFAGWIYVPFSSYLTTKGSIGEPEQGIYGNFAISSLTILTGPYNTRPEGCSSVLIDEIMLVKPGMTNEELAAQQQQQEQPGGETTTTEKKPATQAPATTTAKPGNETEAPATTEATKKAKKSGCGSSVALSSAVALITVIGGGAVLLRKKKHPGDN